MLSVLSLAVAYSGGLAAAPSQRVAPPTMQMAGPPVVQSRAIDRMLARQDAGYGAGAPTNQGARDRGFDAPAAAARPVGLKQKVDVLRNQLDIQEGATLADTLDYIMKELGVKKTGDMGMMARCDACLAAMGGTAAAPPVGERPQPRDEPRYDERRDDYAGPRGGAGRGRAGAGRAYERGAQGRAYDRAYGGGGGYGGDPLSTTNGGGGGYSGPGGRRRRGRYENQQMGRGVDGGHSNYEPGPYRGMRQGGYGGGYMGGGYMGGGYRDGRYEAMGGGSRIDRMRMRQNAGYGGGRGMGGRGYQGAGYQYGW